MGEIPEPDSFLLLSCKEALWCPLQRFHLGSVARTYHIAFGYKGDFMSPCMYSPSTRRIREQLLRVHLSTLL